MMSHAFVYCQRQRQAAVSLLRVFTEKSDVSNKFMETRMKHYSIQFHRCAALGPSYQPVL